MQYIIRYGCLLLMLSIGSGIRAQTLAGMAEVQVNTNIANAQTNPAVAQAPDGSYFVTWESFAQDGDDSGIYGQLYNQDGTVNGSEFQVNVSYTTYGQRFPDAAMDGSANFFVSYESEDSDRKRGIVAAFDNSGNLISENSEGTSGDLIKQTAVEVNDAGDKVVMVFSQKITGTSNFDIFLVPYDGSLAQLASEVVVNDSATGDQSMPDIAMDSTGNFVVVWQSEGYDGDGLGVFGQMYDASRNKVGSEFQVNTTTVGNQQEPAVGMDADGNFVVSWSNFDAGSANYNVFAQRFSSTGATLGSEFVVNTTTSGGQDHSHIACNREGGFAISWSSYGQDGDKEGVYVQIFNSTGTASGVESIVNVRTSDFQQFGDLAWSMDSVNMIMAWQDGLRASTNTQDGDSYGVFKNDFGINDTDSPVAVCQNATVYLDAFGAANLAAGDLDGGSTDNIGIVSWAASPDAFTCSELGSNNSILTVTDASSNASSCTSVVTVLDSTAPSAVCQDMSLYLDGSGTASLSPSDIDGGSSDNCSIDSLAIPDSTFGCIDLGSQIVSLLVFDPSGNSSSCTAAVTILDSIAPEAVCNSSNLYLNSSGTANLDIETVNAGSSDNCVIDSMSFASQTFDCADLGSTYSSYLLAYDASGNVDSCLASFVIADSLPVNAVCNDLTVYLDQFGLAEIVVADVDGGSTDNCSLDTLYISQSSFDCSNLGTNTVTLSIEDGNGHTGTCESLVEIVDSIAPTAICMTDTVYLDAMGTAVIVVGDVDGGSSDNCGINTSSVNPSSFTSAELGTNQVTLTLTDASGNQSSCLAQVVVMDSNATGLADPALGVFNCDFYPNPSSGFVNLDLNDLGGWIGEYLEMRVVNLHGQVLIRRSWEVDQSSMRKRVDLSGYANGSYILELRINSVLFRKRLIKQ